MKKIFKTKAECEAFLTTQNIKRGSLLRKIGDAEGVFEVTGVQASQFTCYRTIIETGQFAVEYVYIPLVLINNHNEVGDVAILLSDYLKQFEEL